MKYQLIKKHVDSTYAARFVRWTFLAWEVWNWFTADKDGDDRGSTQHMKQKTDLKNI